MEFNGFSHLGDGTKGLAQHFADSSLAGNFGIEELVDAMNIGIGVDEDFEAGDTLDLFWLDVCFVDDLADQFFNDIFQTDDAQHVSQAVDYDGQVDMRGLKVDDQVVGRGGFWNEISFLDQGGETGVFASDGHCLQ